MSARAWLVLAFSALALVYVAWATGLTFRFTEVPVFPTYDMLARGWAQGQVFIVGQPQVDYVEVAGRKSFYFGPAPALFHLPFVALGSGLPTGLAVALFGAGCAVMLWRTLALVAGEGLETGLLAILGAFNGYILLAQALPIIHHEAILCGSLFLLAGLHQVLRIARDGFAPGAGTAALAGACLALAVASRFSYFLSAWLLLGVVLAGVWRTPAGPERERRLWRCLPLLGMLGLGLAALLAYNYARFGDPFDFGLKNPASIYRAYFLAGHYWRYDHVPLNLWSYFFRLPEVVPQPPYLLLPFYLHEVRDRLGSPYLLMHANELAVSVFALMPVLLLAAVPFLPQRAVGPDRSPACALLLAVMAAQLAPVVWIVAASARYYLEFLPLLFLLTALGARQLGPRLRRGWLLALGGLSLVLSFSLVPNGLRVYERYLSFRPALLELVQRLGAP